MRGNAILVIGLVVLGLAVAGAVGVMWARRAQHERALRAVWTSLAVEGRKQRFDAAMLATLPEPARRWLTHAIAPGTPLAASVELRMHGSIVLRQDQPPLPMVAEQVLSPPRGFVWRARVGRGAMRIRGFDRYDGRGLMRWWLWGLFPVMTAEGVDVDRSAAGRLGGEATLLPSSLLPSSPLSSSHPQDGGVSWDAVDDSSARARLDVHGEAVAFTITVDSAGALRRVVIDRWNGDPANGPLGYLPFEVEFEGERSFGGYTIPASLRAGWRNAGQLRHFFFAELDQATYR